MISDLETDDLGESVSADLCIIGGGAAGISLALQLADKPWRIVLLESGGESYDVRTQALYDGKSLGREYFSLMHDRVRYLGGTTHHWGGWCVQLTEGDLQRRNWIPDSGWPIQWGELATHYPRAQEICELGRPDYDPAAWLEPEFPLLRVDDSVLQNYLVKWSPDDQSRLPTHFGKVYAKRLRAADKVQVILHANVYDIDCNENITRLRSVTAKTLDGREIQVQASRFVLAAGGIENPRILLNANRQASRGLGNDKDLVGRYFMDHMEGMVGHIPIDDRDRSRWISSYQKRILQNEKIQISAAIRPSEQVLRDRRTLNAGFVIRSAVDEQSGYVSAKRLARSFAGKEHSDRLRDIGNVLTDLDEVAKWIHHRRKGTHYDFPTTSEPARVWISAEQAPNPSSRVVLSDDRDELGMPKIALDWRLSGQDKRTLRESTRVFAEEVLRITGSRVKIAEYLLSADDELPTAEIWGGHHHMGTTRMSHSPTTGVVDTNCRVFGLDNLYVAGSSVFPTVGYANPTLTIVALAIRLAGHLDAELAKAA